MSSDDDLQDLDDGGLHDLSHAAGNGDSKRRKLMRYINTKPGFIPHPLSLDYATRLACDVCRRKKIRARDARSYIDDLEERCHLLEQLVLALAPDTNLDDEIGPAFTKENWATVKGSRYSRGGTRQSSGTLMRPPTRASSSIPTLPPSPTLGNPFIKHLGLPEETLGRGMLPHPNSLEETTLDLDCTEMDSDNEQNYTTQTGSLTKHIETRLDQLKITHFHKRFHGKVAMNLKDQVTGSASDAPARIFNLRPKFWRPSPWEWIYNAPPPLDSLTFPPDDLMDELIELCFKTIMVLFPVVHRPTLEKQRRENRHRNDINFARVLLGVCAIGARFSDDERVCLPSEDGSGVEWNSAGWKYFTQIVSLKRPILSPAGLSDLQSTALSAIYLYGTSAPHSSWLIAGIGLRFAQDIGAHREKVYGPDHPFENQLWKRAFWSLVALDRVTSAGLGRPIAAFDEDIDADLPLEVDDEYYDEEKKEWKQPADKPSKLAAFTQYCKLQGILAYATRTVYSINKSKVHLGFVGPEWESRTVAELDSALNSWLDNIPDHLIWDPNIEDPTFFVQAAILRVTYHYVQITIHRPFIPALTGNNSSPLAFPSLAICTNAARSVSHILETWMKKGVEITPLLYIIAFQAGTILLISIWGVKKTKLNVDVSSQAADVQRCIKVLHNAENKWYPAGKLCDILTELASFNEVPLPEHTSTPPDTTRKRNREEDDASSTFVASPSSYTSNSPCNLSLAAQSSTSPSRSLGTPLLTVPQHSPSRAGPSMQKQQFASMCPLQAMQQPNIASAFGVPNPAGTAGLTNMQWDSHFNPPMMSGFDSSFESFHIAGRSGGVPGLLPGHQALSDAMSPNSLFHELLGSFENEVPAQQDQGGMGSMSDLSWMSDLGLFSTFPQSGQPHNPSS
ncbi:hypothetical protein FRC04_002761 [Tulasnella sp. 424]|nr:hypothetical protein FRC04_002761 [Tulasnella sp. 424]